MARASAWPLVVTALVAKMRARPGYCSPTSAASGIPVYHSVEVGLSSHSPTGPILVIGWIGDPDTMPTEPGTSGQSIATLGTQHHRAEEGTIACAVIAKTGDAEPGGDTAVEAGTVGSAMNAVFAVADDLDAVLRADPSLGIVGPTYPDVQALVAYIDGLPAVQPWLNEGIVWRLELSVRFTARI